MSFPSTRKVVQENAQEREHRICGRKANSCYNDPTAGNGCMRHSNAYTENVTYHSTILFLVGKKSSFCAKHHPKWLRRCMRYFFLLCHSFVLLRCGSFSLNNTSCEFQRGNIKHDFLARHITSLNGSSKLYFLRRSDHFAVTFLGTSKLM